MEPMDLVDKIDSNRPLNAVIEASLDPVAAFVVQYLNLNVPGEIVLGKVSLEPGWDHPINARVNGNNPTGEFDQVQLASGGSLFAVSKVLQAQCLESVLNM